MDIATEPFEEAVAFERKNLADGEMDITPMIDIVFLLLIFFVVTSKMTAEQAPKVPAAKHGESVDIRGSVALTVTRGGGETALVRTDSGRTFAQDPDQQTAEIIEYVSGEVEKGKSNVLLRVEGDVRNGETKRIRDALAESLDEGQMINISVTDET